MAYSLDNLIEKILARNVALEAEGKRLAQQEADRVYAPYSAAINENLQRLQELQQIIEDKYDGKYGSQSDNTSSISQ